MTQLTTVVFW